MRLEEILKIENGMTSARELKDFLEIKRRFSVWIEQYVKVDNKYGFEEILDFTGVRVRTVVNNGAEIEIDDYIITLDMAKEISMITGTPKGKQARRYFIQAEKQLQEELINKIKLETENEKLRADNLELELQVLKSKSMKFTYKDKRILTDKLYPILRTLNVKEKLISECHDFIKYNLIGKYENITEDADFSEEDFINKYRSFAEDMKENKSFYFEDKETYDLFYYMNNL